MMGYGHEFGFIGMLLWILVVGGVVYLVVRAISTAAQPRERDDREHPSREDRQPKQRTGITDWTVRDPVCGAEGPASQAHAHTEYRGRVYFFCSETCRNAFLESPHRYAIKRPETGGPHHHQHAPAR